MRKKTRREEDTNIAFLDVMSCGFGAIVLLLIIVRIGDPKVLEESENQLEGLVKESTEQLFEIRGEADKINQELKAKQAQLSEIIERIARTKSELAAVDAQANKEAQASTTEEDELRLALQILSEEQERLLGKDYRRVDNVIGGIPVDSEYVIFVIDTSGSMQGRAWGKLREEMINILDIYPDLKGIQVFNDMGNSMFPVQQTEWLEDSPTVRKQIEEQLQTWRPFSNSSPVEGIERAIRTFYSADKKISIYVLGDDFTGRSIRQVVSTVNTLNSTNADENKRVRIHAIGFPVQINGGRPSSNAIRFANLMRELSYQNSGSFVGLNNLNI